MGMGVGEQKERNGRKRENEKRLQGINTMCKIVDDLGHVFDKEKEKVLSDSVIVMVM